MDTFFQIKVKEQIKNIFSDGEETLRIWNTFNLSEREEKIFYHVFYSEDYASGQDFVNTVKKTFDYFKSADVDSEGFFAEDKMESIILSKTFLENELNFNRILLSVIFWNKRQIFEDVVRVLIGKLDVFTLGSFDYEKYLSQDWLSRYERLTWLIFSEYFPWLSDTHQMFFINSPTFIFSTLAGLDTEMAVSVAVDEYIYIENRRDKSIKFAAFLYDNVMPIGFNPVDGQSVKLDFWVDKFRIYSNNHFDGVSLIKFIDDQEVVGNNDVLTKQLIRFLLTLYGELINGTFVYPQLDDVQNLLKSEQDEIKINDKKTSIKERFLNLSDPTEIITKLQELSKENNDPKILELYYYDETAGDFKWKE